MWSVLMPAPGRRRDGRGLIAASVLLCVTGCSTGERRQSDDDTPVAAPTSSPAPAGVSPSETALDDDASEVLRAARNELTESGTAGWVATLETPGGTKIFRERGVLRLDPPASIATKSTADGLQPLLVSVVRGRDQWIHQGELESTGGCWLHRDLSGAQYQGVSRVNLVPEIPRILLFREQTAETQPDAIRGFVNLVTVALAFGELVLVGMGDLQSAHDASAPVSYELVDGAFTGYRVALDDLVESARDAGLEVNPQLDDLHLVLEMKLKDVGKPVEVPTPVPDRVIELGLTEPLLHRDPCAA